MLFVIGSLHLPDTFRYVEQLRYLWLTSAFGGLITHALIAAQANRGGTQMNAKPQVGQLVKVSGKDYRIVKVYAVERAIDVVSLDGSKYFRLSGLAF